MKEIKNRSYICININHYIVFGNIIGLHKVQ